MVHSAGVDRNDSEGENDSIKSLPSGHFLCHAGKEDVAHGHVFTGTWTSIWAVLTVHWNFEILLL